MSPADTLRLILLSSLWGMSFIFMRVAVPEFGPVPLILIRMGVGAALLIPLLLSLRYLRLVWQNKGGLLLLGLVNHVLPFSLLALATTRLEAGFTSLINATTPIFTALLGALFFATPVLRQQYLGLAMAFVGVYVLSADRLDFALGGDGWFILAVLGATENFVNINFLDIQAGRFFTETEVVRRRNVVVLGQTPYQALFGASAVDPIGKRVRLGAAEYTVIGVVGKRPSAGGFDLGQDDFVVIPETTYRKQFGIQIFRQGGATHQSVLIAVAPRTDGDRTALLTEVEEIMRIRHELTLDEPNDFDLITQDAALDVWNQVSQATLLTLIVISSIALMVGGIGVMAIMTISVTERTREIGLRKALGARRQEILFQFLAEAAVLTLLGGMLGIAIGSAIGVTISLATGFPVSLPWWSFALGLGFSATVGIVFGMIPAVRAARLDPIEALRHE